MVTVYINMCVLHREIKRKTSVKTCGDEVYKSLHEHLQWRKTEKHWPKKCSARTFMFIFTMRNNNLYIQILFCLFSSTFEEKENIKNLWILLRLFVWYTEIYLYNAVRKIWSNFRQKNTLMYGPSQLNHRWTTNQTFLLFLIYRNEVHVQFIFRCLQIQFTYIHMAVFSCCLLYVYIIHFSSLFFFSFTIIHLLLRIYRHVSNYNIQHTQFLLYSVKQNPCESISVVQFTYNNTKYACKRGELVFGTACVCVYSIEKRNEWEI